MPSCLSLITSTFTCKWQAPCRLRGCKNRRVSLNHDGTDGKVISRHVCPVYAPGDEMVPPIKYGLGYRSRTRTRTLRLTTEPNPNRNLNPKSNNNVCSTKRHRNKVQHSVICKSYFRWTGGGYTKGLYRKWSPIWWLVNHGNHWRSKRDPRAKQGFEWGK